MRKFSVVILLLLGSRAPLMAQFCDLVNPQCNPSNCLSQIGLPGVMTGSVSASAFSACQQNATCNAAVSAGDTTQVGSCSENMTLDARGGWYQGGSVNVYATGTVWKASDGSTVLFTDTASYCVANTPCSWSQTGPTDACASYSFSPPCST